MKGARGVGKAEVQSCPSGWHLWVRKEKENSPHELQGFDSGLFLLFAASLCSTRCLLCLPPLKLSSYFWILGRVLFDVFFISGELGEVLTTVPAVGPCLLSAGF